MDNQNYFTAEEAREVSDSVNSKMFEDELNWIYKLIDDARFKGLHAVTFSNQTLMSATIKFLKAKGFKISHFSGTQWDPADDTTITW